MALVKTPCTNVHDMCQKQYRNIRDIPQQENLEYIKYSQWGRFWGRKMGGV
jgi:hypothetical protein